MANLGPTPWFVYFVSESPPGPRDTIHIAPTPEVAHLFGVRKTPVAPATLLAA